ncbi:D-mannose binding lectin [Quadrisphaera granulorum]|uniref:D-mannose binding lectin n=1 Tax=Quadrisphaera granulorum TaxID=317664 RepID=A0A316ABJ7_9ACTN|nr:curculin (mannose-binding) lectin [Quadrisphaera granulorum]PWJ55083.1 D-mannose binding lectin [Quadrisphaera granulorum]SZE95592.1 D-mannose binding lectin [Quadrisphaera granulorum]
MTALVRLICSLALGCLVAFAAAAPASAAPSPAGGDRMSGGQELSGGQWLMSPNRTHGLAFQTDGDLVAYAPHDRATWRSGTGGNPGARFVLQPDGNAVIYAADGRVLWHAGSYGNPGAVLRVQDDGNVVVYRTNGSAAWYSGWDRTGLASGQALYRGQQVTSANGTYRLLLQDDGNAVIYGAKDLYSPQGRPLYFSGSYGADRLVLQGDGNLVAYAGSRAVWNSGTWRASRATFVLQDDGSAVVARRDGTAAWATTRDIGQHSFKPNQRWTSSGQTSAPGFVGCSAFQQRSVAQAEYDKYLLDFGDPLGLDPYDAGVACWDQTVRID